MTFIELSSRMSNWVAVYPSLWSTATKPEVYDLLTEQTTEPGAYELLTE